jgi:hypothetical protein
MLPPSLRQRLSQIQFDTPPSGDPGINIGDIRILEGSTSGPRLALVLRIDADRASAEVTLVHPYIDYSTEFDLVVDRSRTQMPFDVVVQTDIASTVFLTQLGPRHGTVSMEVVDACVSGRDRVVTTSDLFAGPRLLGPLDARWHFKVEEGQALSRLSMFHAESFLAVGTAWAFPNAEFFSRLLRKADDTTAMVLEIYEEFSLRGRDLVLTLDQLCLLDDQELLNPNNWRKALGDEGVALLMQFVDHARSTVDREPVEVPELMTLVGSY